MIFSLWGTARDLKEKPIASGQSRESTLSCVLSKRKAKHLAALKVLGLSRYCISQLLHQRGRKTSPHTELTKEVGLKKTESVVFFFMFTEGKK